MHSQYHVSMFCIHPACKSIFEGSAERAWKNEDRVLRPSWRGGSTAFGRIATPSRSQGVPAEVVRCFLQRCSEGAYILSPSVPYRWHKLENQSLRAAHGVPDGISGVLLTSVSPSVAATGQEGASKQGPDRFRNYVVVMEP